MVRYKDRYPSLFLLLPFPHCFFDYIRNAVPLLNMDILLESTYDEITKLATKIQSKQKEIKVLACNLACAIQLMQRLIRYKFDLDNTSIARSFVFILILILIFSLVLILSLMIIGFLILQSYLSAQVNDESIEQQQGWEESTNASLVQLLRTVLASSAAGLVCSILLFFYSLSFIFPTFVFMKTSTNHYPTRYGNTASTGDANRH